MKKASPAPAKKVTKAPATPFVASGNFAYGLAGSDVELGEFDPLGFSTQADEATVNWYRAAEIKHGRVAMLAMVGHIVTTAGIRLPGNIDVAGDKFSDYPAGLAALATMPLFGVFQLIASIGWWDLKVWKQVEGSTPGDFGIPYLKQFKTDAQKGVCLSFIIIIRDVGYNYIER